MEKSWGSISACADQLSRSGHREGRTTSWTISPHLTQNSACQHTHAIPFRTSRASSSCMYLGPHTVPEFSAHGSMRSSVCLCLQRLGTSESDLVEVEEICVEEGSRREQNHGATSDRVPVILHPGELHGALLADYVILARLRQFNVKRECAHLPISFRLKGATIVSVRR
jgi:hypothetical protein